MADDKTTLRVLGIAGSLRAGSFNRALLRAAQELAPDGMEIRAFDIAPIPSPRRSRCSSPRCWSRKHTE
jgi:NAD(P)H-dependent FMN reductase